MIMCYNLCTKIQNKRRKDRIVKILNLPTVIKNKIKMRHTTDLSLLLSVSVMTGLYNIDTCIDVDLGYYEYSVSGYPVKLGKRGIDLLTTSKDTCKIIDICNQVCEIFDVEHNLKTSQHEFQEGFYHMYKMAVVTKHIKDFPTTSEPHFVLQK